MPSSVASTVSTLCSLPGIQDLSIHVYKPEGVRLEPIILKNLLIIPSQTSQYFYPLFFFIPIAPSIISIVLMIMSQYRSDYILFT